MKIFISLALLVTLIPTRLFAADFRIEGDDVVRVFVMEGEITKGDTDKFVKLVRSGNKKVWPTVYLMSPGGDFEESMRLGRVFRALEMQTIVPTRSANGPVCKYAKPLDQANCTCASACFFAHIGSVQRGGSYLIAHRPYFVKGAFGQLGEEDAEKKFEALQKEAHGYMQEMGVPDHLVTEILATPSDNGLLLGQHDIDLYFNGFLPARHEWLRNKCSTLSADEESRMEAYTQRVLDGSSKGLDAGQVLSLRELEDMAELSQRDLSPACMLTTMKKKRSEAFDKFFGIQK